MRGVNINHPSFVSFLDTVNASILNNISVNTYFTMTPDKKLGVQYMVLKLMKNSVKVRAKLTDTELKSFTSILCKKNEDSENYEFAEVLKDMITNFDSINEPSKIPKRQNKTIKVDKTDNG